MIDREISIVAAKYRHASDLEAKFVSSAVEVPREILTPSLKQQALIVSVCFLPLLGRQKSIG